MKMNAVTTAVLAVVAIGGVGAGVLAFSGAASAQQATPTATAPAASPTAAAPRTKAAGFDNFAQKLAANLHISLDQLTQGVKNTELEIVGDLASKGTITQGQAQQLTGKINSGGGLGLRALVRAVRRMHRGDTLVRNLRAEIVASSAKAIGVTPQDLRGELKSGKSIADVAAEHQVSLDAVKAQITSDLKAKLDRAVQAKKIDQTREDALLKKLDARPDTILNRKVAGHSGAATATPAN
ncbi:MAG TPA: hypothetical protein VEZ14_03610 [Dehalococcoidia bacterium]|nr:hypothetical protein [Dehalococcoidia bacterium]